MVAPTTENEEEKFSTFLKKSSKDFRKAGLLDQPLLRDAHFHIDVFKFKDVDVEEFRDSYKRFISHFQKFFQLVKTSRSNGLSALTPPQVAAKRAPELRKLLKEADLPFKGAYNHLDFTEIDGFNLGYSKTLRGASIGPSFKMQLIKAAQELLSLNIEDPEVFCLLPFLQEGIGCDRISDMFISINYLGFLKFTERKLKELGVHKVAPFEIDGHKFDLIKPTQFRHPMILVPKHFVKRLPLSFGWDDIFSVYDENSALRNKLNRMILSHYVNKTDITKAKVAELLRSDPTLLKQIIMEFKDTTSFSQLERDLIQDLEEEIRKTDSPSSASLKEHVQFILNKFKWFVEKKGTWRLFYQRKESETGTRTTYPLSEEHVQRAFHIVAELLAEKLDVEVTPEADTGVGVVDFKFSRTRSKVLIEVKLSTHDRLVHGFETQLDQYIEAERPEYSYFLVVLVDNADPEEMKVDMRRMERLKTAIRAAGLDKKQVFVVNALPKISASKVKPD